jgi:hypothetical protein
MSAVKAKTTQTATDRKDGRRTLLLYLKPEIIKSLKKAALDQDRHAYEIAEDALKEWLSPKGASRSKA